MKIKRKKSNSPALEWLNDLSGKTARITSIGGRSLLVENHCGIEKYSAECVCLKTRCGIIKAEGANLTLREVRKGALIISGDIRHVELPCTIDS
ncbi:MAG: YabP/YqfC family sporulation protein [Clostridia bacterium]|nr:YabP/YqfC family sporulation protein [Clostridia bacterium]